MIDSRNIHLRNGPGESDEGGRGERAETADQVNWFQQRNNRSPTEEINSLFFSLP